MFAEMMASLKRAEKQEESARAGPTALLQDDDEDDDPDQKVAHAFAWCDFVQLSVVWVCSDY